jgi:hypothetical protein
VAYPQYYLNNSGAAAPITVTGAFPFDCRLRLSAMKCNLPVRVLSVLENHLQLHARCLLW